MNFNIICVGKIKESALTELILEYQKRISKYAHLEILELSDEPIPEHFSEKEALGVQKIEGEKMLKLIKPSDFVIALDPKGKELSSEEFAETLDKIPVQGFSTIDFVIGGSLGISKEVLANSNLRLSFSKLTFPHQLFRLVLLEQIFRAQKINHHERYHL